MGDRELLLDVLAPVIGLVGTLDPGAADTLGTLARRFPLDGEVLGRVRTLLRAGIAARTLCERENAGVRYSRVRKAEGEGWSVDAVHLDRAGGAHLHPRGEIDLCFAVSGAPRFDGRLEGWVVYAANTWHVPTVAGGVMDILYFLPAGAITFGPQPAGSILVGS